MTTRATRSPRRRTVVALGVILAVLAGFLVRLVDIQVVNAQAHVAESLEVGNLEASRVLHGNRGAIVDESGVALATSVMLYDAQLDPMTIMLLEEDEQRRPALDWEHASAAIAEITGQSAEEIRGMVAERLAEDPQSQYLPLRRGLSSEQYLRLRELGLPYLAMPGRTTRVYPNGAVAGNLLGFVGDSGEGQAGLETAQEQCLKPTDGGEVYLRGVDGVVIPGSQRTIEAVDGGTLQLTIDNDLQWYLQQMITEETLFQGALSGSVTVVEVATGKIRAAAEYPVVDPNDVDASDPADRGSRIFTTTFEPGSTFKTVTAAAVMEGAGLHWDATVVADSRETFPNGAVINDHYVHPTFTYTLAGALIDSSNVALSKFGDMVSPETRFDYLEAFGVGSPTAVGFPGEESGILHPVEDWDSQSRYTTTFGQYYTVTAPQVASVYQTIANGGLKMPLSLVENCTLADGTVVEPELPEPVQVIQPGTAAELSRIVENVAAQGSLADQITVAGYRVAGKTGTAEKPGEGGRYKDGIYFTSFAGYAPADDPQYVVVVTLDEPTRVTSSAATASAFQKAMTQVLKTYRVQPSLVPMEEPLPVFG